MATHSSILAWRSPWTEEPGFTQSRTRLKWLSILYWCFSFWLTSLCIMGSSFIHLIRTDSNAFFLIAEWYSIVYMYHSFLIHSSADGHLGFFHGPFVFYLLWEKNINSSPLFSFKFDYLRLLLILSWMSFLHFFGYYSPYLIYVL